MRLLSQVLRLCFWALPVQRVCVIVGMTLMLVIALVVMPSFDQAVRDPRQAATWARAFEWGYLGLFIAFLPALFTGGPIWRALCAQRATALAPRGRARLLAAAFLMVVLGSLTPGLLELALRAGQLHAVPSGRLISNFWVVFVGTFQFGSWWGLASFFAARSLLATFTVLLVLVGGTLAIVLIGLPTPSDFGRGPVLALSLLMWAVFAVWYLRCRRIAPPVWTSRRTDDVSLVTQADTGGIAAGIPRDVALERLLLGGRNTGRILLQWLVAVALLQAMLLGVRAFRGVEPGLVAPTQFLVLLLVLPAVGAVSWLVASRLRHLWLASGYSRADLFALAEQKVLLLAAGLSAISAGAFLWLWFATPPQSDVSLAFGLCALLGAVLLPAYAPFIHSKAGVLAACVLAVLVVLQTYMHAFVNQEPGGSWLWLAPLPVAIFVLRQLARRSWLGQDMPRPASGPAS